MSKLLLFVALTWLTGSPIIAIIVLIVIFYVLERRFIGLSPSVVKPLKRVRKLSKLRQELRLSPHQTTAKLEMARLWMEQRKYTQAHEYLLQISEVMKDSAEVQAELGICELKLGHLQQGEQSLLQALELNPRVKYGEPYLRLAEAWADQDPHTSIAYLKQFQIVNSSSCEAYYRLGQLYHRLGSKAEAREAYRATVELYRGLPRYKRRFERRWVVLARIKGLA
ncbi:Tetratricopeptide repeat-containing protein [Paenibacillus sp. 1_12]|uniref:tetratricopeptide repeat protein n=1 Tax=Paenibacillus sp. 1_12 TaxID=1566278 RepID=UPI0008E17B6A|nr:tetratricopeptide repeat protein [Paenibacillus sp. 1_12]SFL57044.1 Tetratricopeptide repeat-containing protein [Paenibacillus sp. 1_12]